MFKIGIVLLTAGLFALCQPALAQQNPIPSSPQRPDVLTKDVAMCLRQARAALGPSMIPNEEKQIDAYAADGRIFFNNPFATQNPTFAFWKCLRLKGYKIDG